MKIVKSIVLAFVLCVTALNAAVVSPPDVQGLGLWYSADDLDGDGIIEGAGEDGLVNNTVSVWVDKSGNGRDATQASTSARPAYITDGAEVGGVYLSFDGSDDVLNFSMSSASHTVFIVSIDGIQAGTWRGKFNMAYSGSGANTRAPFMAYRSTTDTRLCVSYYDVNGTNQTTNLSPGLTQSWHLFTLSKAEGLAKSIAYRNGSFLGETPNAFEQINPPSTPCYIGKGPGCWNGSIAEVLVYERGLSDEERNIVGYYLETKYGLATDYTEAPVPVADITETDGSTVVTEEGTTDSLNISLVKAPLADVTITPSFTGSDIEVSPSSMIFTTSDWDTAQTFTVSAVDDSIYEGQETVTLSFDLSSSDPNFTSANAYCDTVEVSIEDNDDADIFLSLVGSELVVSEEVVLDESNKFEVVLSNVPSDQVAVTLNITMETSEQSRVTLSPSSLIFDSTDYNAPQVVTVAAIDGEDWNHNSEEFYITAMSASADPIYADVTSKSSLAGIIYDNDCGRGDFFSGDVNEDCEVNMTDFKIIAETWQDCTTPNEAGCIELE
ncbi:MAG: hypothetical protein ACIAQZ_00870 [Sedimentisphaeraceae bacterium JB056]